MALEERIGNVSTGLSEETIMKLLKQKKYSVEPGSQRERESEPCCVCQVKNMIWLFSLTFSCICTLHMGSCSDHLKYVNVMHRRSITMETISDHWIAGTITIRTVLNSG